MKRESKKVWIKPKIEDFSLEDTLGVGKERNSFIESFVGGEMYFGADSRGPS